MKYLLAAFIVIFIVGVAFAYSIFSWGFVCYKFWGWFITPVFTQAPAITYMQAVGLIFFINLFKEHSSSGSKKEESSEDKYSKLAGWMLAPWILLLLASLFV
jgi:hypothetical protein